MCLAIPAKVLKIDDDNQSALVAIGDITKTISLAFLESTEVGDFVLIHVGYALEKIRPEEAEHTLQLFAEISDIEMRKGDELQVSTD